jgi:hypothetical protein
VRLTSHLEPVVFLSCGHSLAPVRDHSMSNCLFYAIRLWWTRGGYVIVTKSKFWWGPHVLWSPDLRTFCEFHPTAPKRRRIMPPLWFHGYGRLAAVGE